MWESRQTNLHGFWNHFGWHFPSKVDEQIEAIIDAEKVREIKEKTMRKRTCILMIFGFASHEKSRCSKKVHVREPSYLPSRTRVGDGSPKKKESKQK